MQGPSSFGLERHCFIDRGQNGVILTISYFKNWREYLDDGYPHQSFVTRTKICIQKQSRTNVSRMACTAYSTHS